MINKNRLSSYILILGFILVIIFISLEFFDSFVNSNFFLALITLIVGGIAIYLYLIEKRNKKRDAAKIILQEVRRAEDIISDYKEHRQYKFTKKIIATNSWAKNIHYFVGDLNVDELDKISNLYSTGEYLDSIITKISDFNFKQMTSELEENLKKFKQQIQDNQNLIDPNSSGGNVQQGQHIISGQKNKEIEIQMPAPWKELLDEITDRYEPIYHSNIINKLNKIAKLK